MVAVAFFDIDGTVLAKNSGPLYMKFLVREGRLSKLDLIRGLWWYVLYRMNMLNWERMTEKALATTEGQSEDDMIRQCNRWFERDVKRHIRPQMVELMQWRRREGHKVVLLSAATIYLARPLGEHLCVDDYICNHLEVKDGVFTGKLVRPACYGEGKVELAEKYAAEEGVALDSCYFYTDSITDLPLLEKVGHPVVVSPDPLLRREAKRRDWPIYDYE